MNQNINPVPDFSILLVFLALFAIIPTACIITLVVARTRPLRVLAIVGLALSGCFVLLSVVLAVTSWVKKPAAAETTALPSVETQAWSSSAEDALETSIFSSPESASLWLARQSLQQHMQHISEPPAAVEITIAGQLSESAPSLGTELASVCRDSFPLSRVTQTELSQRPKVSELPPEVLSVIVDAIALGRTTGAPWDKSHASWSGQMRLTSSYQGRTFEHLKQFTEKPWVNHFDTFISQRPQRRFLKADSSSFSLTEQESDRSARDAAAVLVWRQIEADGGDPSPELRKAVRSALENEGLIIDRFSQKLAGRSGEVWRTSLLLDGGPEKLARVTALRSVERSYKLQRRSVWLGLGVLLALTVFLYFVLDELTRGYFAWNLRATALLTMLTLAVAFCWWMNMTA